MRKKTKVLKSSNLPAKLPTNQTLLWFLALSYLKAPQWLWGVAGVIILLLWVITIWSIVTDEYVDVFKNNE